MKKEMKNMFINNFDLIYIFFVKICIYISVIFNDILIKYSSIKFYNYQILNEEIKNAFYLK